MAQSEIPAAAQGPRRAGVEGRTQKRYRCREKKIVRFAIRPSFENFQALVRDVSTSGIGFLYNQPLDIGTLIAIQLKGKQPGSSMVRMARVVHIRRHFPVKDAPWVKKKPLLQSIFCVLGGEEKEPEPQFIYLIGCRMSVPLSPEELEGLCDTSSGD
jgi:hypothetical protein